MRMARALLTLLAVLCAVGGRGWARVPAGDRVRASHLHPHPHPQPHPQPHPVLYVPRDRLANSTPAANTSIANSIQEMGGARWGGGGGAGATAAGAWKRAMWQEMQAVLVREGAAAGATGAAGAAAPGGVECCPTVQEMIEPEGGRNPQGLYVDLYKSGPTRQRFYELSCHKDFLNKPCRFIDHRLYNSSRCVQQFSYSYALVRDAQASTAHPAPHRHARHEHAQSAHLHDAADAGGWSLDYIRVRAGCSCEIVKERKRRPERHKHKRLKNKRTFSEDDDT